MPDKNPKIQINGTPRISKDLTKQIRDLTQQVIENGSGISEINGILGDHTMRLGMMETKLDKNTKQIGRLDERLDKHDAQDKKHWQRFEVAIAETNAKIKSVVVEGNNRLEIAIAGVNNKIDTAMAGVNNRFDSTVAEFNGRFDSTMVEINNRFDTTMTEINSRFDTTITEFNNSLNSTAAGFNSRLDSTVAEFNSRLDRNTEKSNSRFDITMAGINHKLELMHEDIKVLKEKAARTDKLYDILDSFMGEVKASREERVFVGKRLDSCENRVYKLEKARASLVNDSGNT